MNSLRTDRPGERRLTLYQHVHGKYRAARTLGELMRHFSNWSEIWDAHRGLCPFPPLHLRNGMTLFHGSGDDPIFLYREMFVANPYVRRGFYKPEAGQTVIDLGANLGWFAAFLQSCARGVKVQCFEPGPAAIECLRKNIDVNGMDEFVSVHKFAVTDRIGHSALARHTHSYERRLVADAELEEMADAVETITLERALDIAKAESIDLIKIDVEGAELEIVLGSDARVWKPVRRVALEYHEYLRPGCRKTLIDALQERGFSDIQSERDPDPNERGTIFALK